MAERTGRKQRTILFQLTFLKDAPDLIGLSRRPPRKERQDWPVKGQPILTAAGFQPALAETEDPKDLPERRLRARMPASRFCAASAAEPK
jgi:hypothetical protein